MSSQQELSDDGESGSLSIQRDVPRHPMQSTTGLVLAERRSLVRRSTPVPVKGKKNLIALAVGGIHRENAPAAVTREALLNMG